MSGAVFPTVQGSCQVLKEDPELAEVVPAERREQAIAECTAQTLYIPVGSRSGGATAVIEDGFGLLILDGLMIRRSGVEGRFGAELLGEGDLLRPWQSEHDSQLPPLETGWTVLEPSRVAVLDHPFAERAAAYPQIGPAIAGRVMQRARNLVVNMAIVHQARVDVRVHMLLWHLSGRWGKVRSEGTVLRLRLTHAVLADLVAARRPTVTTAISELVKRGLVRTSGDEWLLLGDPPGELTKLIEPGQPDPPPRLAFSAEPAR